MFVGLLCIFGMISSVLSIPPPNGKTIYFLYERKINISFERVWFKEYIILPKKWIHFKVNVTDILQEILVFGFYLGNYIKP
jgi:hypothetical protein